MCVCMSNEFVCVCVCACVCHHNYTQLGLLFATCVTGVCKCTVRKRVVCVVHKSMPYDGVQIPVRNDASKA